MRYQRLYYYFRSAFSSFLCNEIIKQGFINNPQMATTGYSQPRNKKELNNILQKRKSNISWIGDWWLKKELAPYVIRANKMAGWNFNLSNSEDCQFTKYDEKEHYGWHTDSFTTPHIDGSWKGLIRKISVTVSLSDPNDYEGGFLEFALPKNEPDSFEYIKAREALPRGSIIVFPSYTWHRVTPVTKGTRLSLVQWNLGPGYV